MNITNLRTLHMSEPLGIDACPYFSWHIESDAENVLQEAYQIMIQDDEGDVWDGGEVESRQQSFVAYGGPPLKSRTRYQWRVTVWDNQGNHASAESWFETAIMERGHWAGKWIESTLPRRSGEPYRYGTQPPPVLFTKAFCVKKAVQSARLRATAYGTYIAYVNGEKADDRAFAPEHTVYRNILYYQTYDVAGLLKKGDNALGMYVGDGWYFCPQSQPLGGERREMPAVLFQLELTYTDGTTETIASDGTEQCCTGPVVFSDIFRGEKQDATLGFGVKQPVKAADCGYQHLYAQPMPPVRPMRLMPATSIYRSPKGEWIVDFGQLLCGRARIHIRESKGTELTFEYFEATQKDGSYFNSMYADQKDIYIADGSPCEYEACFTFHGFRYIRVTGMENPALSDFTAVLLTSEKENAGAFECSDERLSRLYKNIRWSQANNMLSIPTDCPSRERAGFTGDIQIYARTALLNENVTPFLSSWLANLAADQTDEGVVPITVPLTKVYENLMLRNAVAFGDETITGVAGWGDAAVMVPYQMYRVTGNTRILEVHYDTMRRWCDYIIKTAGEKRGPNPLPPEIDRYLWNTGFHFGEWLIPSQPESGGDFEICKQSAAYIAPIFGYRSVQMMAEIAAVLARPEQAYYEGTANKMKNAIQIGLMCGGNMPEELMGAYVLPIALGLVPEQYKNRFGDKLVDLLKRNGGCLDTGFLATPYLLDALMKIDRRDLALQVLWQDKQPSWLFEVDHGATAIWESWFGMATDGTPKMTSYDHYAFGCVDEWIFRNIAGIECNAPGFKHFTVRPMPDAPLEWCKRSFISEYGEIRVEWTKTSLMVRVPCNTTATIHWQGKAHEVGSGRYCF